MAKARLAPLIVIVGPTASGKSELAMKLAKKIDGEIIAADSLTLRREVDIGSAKPTKADRAAIKHHLIDIIGPAETFTAAQFKELAERAIKEIALKNKPAILVGGSGLYIDGLLFNYRFLPKSDEALRQRLNSLSRQELVKQIKADGLNLNELDLNNKRRLIRLIETGGARPQRASTLRPNTLIFGLKPSRQLLEEKISRRVDEMIKLGLEDEVRFLSQNYGWQAEALKGVGYKEWQDYFLGQQSLSETRQKIIEATLALAKKQNTWFKRNKSIHWFSTPVNWTYLVELTTTFLLSSGS